MAVCPNCGNQIGEGAVFCDQCGTRLPKPEAPAPAASAPQPVAASVICPSCGAGNVPGEASENSFCPQCGNCLIERWGFNIRKYAIHEGCCSSCGIPIDGLGM